jgi:hypothetical protein
MKLTLLLVTALFVSAVQAQLESPSHKYYEEVAATPESYVNDSVLKLSNQGVFPGLACFPENPVWNMVQHKMESVEHTDFFLVWTPFYLEHTWTDSFKDWAKTTVGNLLHSMLNVPDQESEDFVNSGFVVISEYNNGFQIESHSAIILAGKDGVYTTSGLTAGRIGERGHFAAEAINSGATMSQSRSATAVRTILTLNYATMRFKFTAEGMTNGEWHTLFDDADYGKCEFIHTRMPK